MRITSFSIRRPVTVFMGILIVLMFGVVSYFKLNVDMLPSFNLPMLMMIAQYNGAGPEEIEDLLTKPIEGVLGTVGNVEGINSVSGDGTSILILQFADGTDMDFASLELREKIDMITPILPEGVTKPIIMKMDPNMMPIMSFAVNIEGKTIEELSDIADKTIKPALERIEGVASSDITGLSKSEIKIVADQDKLIANGLTMNNIMSAVKSDNMTMPIGTIVEGSYDLLVRSSIKIESVEEIENILVTNRNGDVFKLKDIATIVEDRSEKADFARLNGEDALIFSIQKESMANTVEVSQKIRKELDNLKASIEKFDSTIVLDQAQFIEFALDAVKMNAILGAILAILIIFIFLKDIRSTFIMALSIPISIISTFIMVYFAGFTLNMISLGGIALGVGMLVDNSIVVIENIYRLKRKGLNNIEAAILGTKEVALAISASTLTSTCVFLPIVFVEGIASEIFREMAYSVAFSLISSLVVSFTLVPLLASRLFKKDTVLKENKFFEKIKGFYKSILVWSLNHKKSVMAILMASILVGGLALTQMGFELFPAADQGVVSIKVTTPKGLSLDKIDDIVTQVSENIKAIPEIENEAVMVNDSGASISVLLKDEREKSDKEIVRDIREVTNQIAGAKIEVSAMSGGISTGSTPLVVKVSGEDFDILNDITEKVKDALGSVEGVIDIKASNDKTSDEIKLVVNKEKAADYGLNNLMITQGIQSSFKNINVDQISIDNKNYGIVLSSAITNNANYTDLENITVTNMMGAKIPLSEIATIKRSKGYNEISRENEVRVVTVSAGIDGIALNDAVAKAQEILSQHNIPSGYNISFGGEVEQMVDAFSQMILALVVAVLLVYMVMAAQFESLINPFIIMFTVPLAFVGAILLLFVMGVNIGITAMIGFIMLSGIIVNNGIVLIDYINKLKSEGMNTRDAILETGPIRLQPILMTALTTIMGLIPMALGLGKGSEIQLPLALTVIGGLVFSTILTLIVIPVIYSIFDSIKNKMKRKKVGN